MSDAEANNEATAPVAATAPEETAPEESATASALAAPSVDAKMEENPTPAPAPAAVAAEPEKKVEAEEEKPAAARTEEPTTTTTDEKPAADVDFEMTDAEPEVSAAAEPAEPAEPEHNADVENTEPAPIAPEVAAVAATGSEAPAEGATPAGKGRRKSSGVPEHKGKKLNKKQSKAKILHLAAKPGDHFFAKLKGFPPWPVIVCDDTMLPQTMLSTRPVSAARPDGTYRDDYADGGKMVAERKFPVMYLYTNEFSWTRNSDLEELDPSTVEDLITSKMRKDLQEAHRLAKEQNDLDHYKQVLRDYEAARLEALEAKAAKQKAKKEKKKKKVEEPVIDDEDVEMPDAEEDEDSETKKQKTKKRKAEEENNTPQRSDSVKKPKIKLTTSSTPKVGTNGVQSPKPAKESASKPAKTKASAGKSKVSKDADGKKAEKEIAAAKEPEMSAEEKHQRKEKEILFLRHRLQKGLLSRDGEPKEEEMKAMSEFLAKLETFPDLEVSIIRVTKINKVLKAILKLESIPKEEEFKFKSRSQALLEQWNKILAAAPTAPTNGVNGTSSEAVPAKAEKEATNGVKQNGDAEAPKEEIKEDTKAEVEAEVKEKEAPKAEAESNAEPKVEEKDEKSAEENTAPANESSEVVETV